MDACSPNQQPESEEANNPISPKLVIKQEEAALMAELKELGELEYDRKRIGLAKRYKISLKTMDKLHQAATKTQDLAGRSIEAPVVVPWAESVDGNALVAEIVQTIKQYQVLKDEYVRAASLWIMATWFIEHVSYMPFLCITSPVMRCGKSTLVDMLSKLSYKPMLTSNMSQAVFFRALDKCPRTILMDEADMSELLKGGFVGILNNSNHRDRAFVCRSVGDNHEPRKFHTWGAFVIAGIITIQTLLRKHGSQDYSDVFKLGINVAFRISDLLSIQKKHINIDKRELVIVEQKTNKKRTVRLNDTAMKIIIRRLSEYPDNLYLFQSSRLNSDDEVQPLDRSTVARKFQEIGYIVGIRLGTHSMRKTRGYMMHKAGVSIEQIARVLNHSCPAVTMAYIGLTKEETLKTYDDFEL